MKANISVSRFISEFKRHNPDDHYFDRETLKFFGEYISEMRILKETVTIEDCRGIVHECYVLSKIQHEAPAGPTKVRDYFDIKTFERVFR